MATNGCFGHSGQYDVSEDIHIGFPIYNNMGIDTKIKSLACLEPPKRKCPHGLPIQVTVRAPQGPRRRAA